MSGTLLIRNGTWFLWKEMWCSIGGQRKEIKEHLKKEHIFGMLETIVCRRTTNMKRVKKTQNYQQQRNYNVRSIIKDMSDKAEK